MQIENFLFMKKNLLLFLGCFALLSVNSQLVNNGAVIRIQPGAFIKCTGDVQNLAGGTITNDGKLEVQGSFTNSAIYNTTTGDDSLIMSGGSGGTVTLNGGASTTLSYLTINKTSAADIVKLAGTTLVGVKLDFLSGTFTTDPIVNPSFVLQSPTSAVYSFAAGMEIVGRVRRTVWSNGPTVVFNAPHMQVSTTGGTQPTDFTVTMIPQSAGGDPTQAEREVKRKFQFAQTGGTGFLANIRFPYMFGELTATNTEANLVPWELIAAEWNGRLTPVTRDGANDWVSTTGIAAAALLNEWKLADPRYTINATAYLRGAWANGPTMTINLRTAGVIPLGQPYNTTPFNYTGTESVPTIPANVTDWILIELRKPASGLPADATFNTVNTVIGRKAGFLLNTGVAVDLDGVTPIAFDINKQGPSFIVVRHRNNLSVMSNSILSNATGTFANNFSTTPNTNVYKAPGASSDPVVLLPSSALYGMWAGDANKSNSVNSIDVNAIKTAISLLLSGYQLQDVNMNAAINSLDVNLTKGTISTLGQSSTPARSITPNPNVIIKSSVPD